MAMATLDSIDRRLLAELQAEGRVTNVDLARRVGLTAPPCLRRVRALECELTDQLGYSKHDVAGRDGGTTATAPASRPC